MQELIIIRGIPGSGKTTMAKSYQGYSESYSHYEADMFFMQNGIYNFDRAKIKNAHNWCQESVKSDLNAGKSVIVSNTFVARWEVQPYVDMALALNVPYKIITATGNYQNVHGVPPEVIERMKKNWENF